MLHKLHRQEALLKLISAERIVSQAELAERLRARDIDATQASISRDLDELGVIKAFGVYTIPRKRHPDEFYGLASLERSGTSLVVARCESGLASAAAVRIDAARIPEIIGTIAGDDTIFIAVKNSAAQRQAIKKVWEIFGTGEKSNEVG